MISVLYLKYVEIIDLSLHFPMKVLRVDLVNLSCLNIALHTRKSPHGVVVLTTFRGMLYQNYLPLLHVNLYD